MREHHAARWPEEAGVTEAARAVVAIAVAGGGGTHGVVQERSGGGGGSWASCSGFAAGAFLPISINIVINFVFEGKMQKLEL